MVITWSGAGRYFLNFNDYSEVRVATFYRPHGIYDTEANMNDLETDGYYVVWGWKVFFEF